MKPLLIAQEPGGREDGVKEDGGEEQPKPFCDSTILWVTVQNGVAFTCLTFYGGVTGTLFFLPCPSRKLVSQPSSLTPSTKCQKQLSNCNRNKPGQTQCCKQEAITDLTVFLHRSLLNNGVTLIPCTFPAQTRAEVTLPPERLSEQPRNILVSQWERRVNFAGLAGKAWINSAVAPAWEQIIDPSNDLGSLFNSLWLVLVALKTGN